MRMKEPESTGRSRMRARSKQALPVGELRWSKQPRQGQMTGPQAEN